jgi:hypothetical protein
LIWRLSKERHPLTGIVKLTEKEAARQSRSVWSAVALAPLSEGKPSSEISGIFHAIPMLPGAFTEGTGPVNNFMKNWIANLLSR